MDHSKWFVGVLLCVALLAGCNNERLEIDSVLERDEELPVIRIISDSQGAISFFQQEEQAIAEKIGVQLEHFFQIE
ncbi:hypothetical protein [Bacillus sp. FJAT-45350]|uniref:hypothetical protein n=1 Tax=Bacillus sp. FJAT-45350 TaxID=2011014 RepID=UPI000BB8FEA4|nr:hypothetical protein [Bacillus sp. FJAT-45350]